MAAASADSRPALEALEARLDANWQSIHATHAHAFEVRSRLLAALEGFRLNDDITLTVFGSVARGESTDQSDLDWTLLVDGQASPEHLDAVHEIARVVEELGFRRPGREGTFGSLAFSHDVLHYIGGGEDDNANMTRRLLLLLESAPIGKPGAYQRTIRQVISRYIVEDFGWMHARNRSNVPRFLLNDIARYWRTVAVDFAYKRRMRQGEGWALRTAKLRLSRKLIYVSGLLICYSCALEERIRDLKPDPEDPTSAEPIIQLLSGFVGSSPLEIIAGVLSRFASLDKHTLSLFDTYDAFLEVLRNDKKRKHLEDLERDDIATDKLYERMRELGARFQEALDGIFLEDNGTELYTLTKTYGVF